MTTPANPGMTIGEWSSSYLIKFIKQLFATDPPASLPRASIDKLVVTGTLSVNDQIKFIRDPNFHFISGTGEPAFANGWINIGIPNNFASYWKDPFGIVHLRGVIQAGVVGSPAFTLPVGLRPLNNENFAVASNNAFGQVQVTSGGDVTPVSPSSNVSVSLDGLTYRSA